MGPGEPGPSAEPTLNMLAAAVAYRVQMDTRGTSNTGCGGIEQAGNGHPLEDKVDLIAPTKDAADSVFTFLADVHFNPSTAPGDPAPDTRVCTQQFGAVFGVANRCGGVWISGQQYHSLHGVTELQPDVQESWVATVYADVSFGQHGGFDTANDGPFQADHHGVFDAPSHPALRLSPAESLPAGVDDAHQYGDEVCGSVTTLSDGGDALATGHIPAQPASWSCDRDDWVQRANLDCASSQDELACYLLPKVGDGFDLRDIDCYDNDVAGTSTTDEQGPLPQGGILGTGILAPGEDCQGWSTGDLPDL